MITIKEEPLPAGGSCLLGSINLSQFVVKPFTNDSYIDFDDLEYTVANSVRALNEVLLDGLRLHPLKEQRDSVYDWRQIGLGTLGMANMLIKLGLTYGTEAANQRINIVYKFIAKTAVETSLQLAKVEGCFPRCTDEIKEAIANSDFIKNLNLSQDIISDIRKYGLFNSQLLTCAPTGTISTLWGESGGVEPNYAFSFNRRTVSLNKEETTYKIDAQIVQDYKKLFPNTELPEYFISSQNIPYSDRIKVQSILQRYIDASISSTANLPNETTVEQVADLYTQAWKEGLKGITIWRDGCQRQAILSTEKPKKENDEYKTPSFITPEKEEQYAKLGIRFIDTTPTPIRKVSDDCIGKKRTLITGCGTLHLTAFFDRYTGKLLETYCSKGSKGGCALFMNGLSRMMSLAARGNISIEAIVDQLKSAGTCPSYAVRTATKHDTSKGSCCPTAIGYALMDMYNEMQKELNDCLGIPSDVKNELQKCNETYQVARYITTLNKKENIIPKAKEHPLQVEPNHNSMVCPKCGEPLTAQGGCFSCVSCGYSRCE